MNRQADSQRAESIIQSHGGIDLNTACGWGDVHRQNRQNTREMSVSVQSVGQGSYARVTRLSAFKRALARLNPVDAAIDATHLLHCDDCRQRGITPLSREQVKTALQKSGKIPNPFPDLPDVKRRLGFARPGSGPGTVGKRGGSPKRKEVRYWDTAIADDTCLTSEQHDVIAAGGPGSDLDGQDFGIVATQRGGSNSLRVPVRVTTHDTSRVVATVPVCEGVTLTREVDAHQQQQQPLSKAEMRKMKQRLSKRQRRLFKLLDLLKEFVVDDAADEMGIPREEARQLRKEIIGHIGAAALARENQQPRDPVTKRFVGRDKKDERGAEAAKTLGGTVDCGDAGAARTAHK